MKLKMIIALLILGGLFMTSCSSDSVEGPVAGCCIRKHSAGPVST